MNLLHTMTFAGTTIIVVYILLKLLLKNKFYPKFRTALLKVSLLYFMVPLCLAKDYYEHLFQVIRNFIGLSTFSFALENDQKIILNNIIEISSEGKILSIQNYRFYIILFVFIGFMIIFLDYELNRYLKVGKLISLESTNVTDQRILEIFNKIKKEMKVRKKVALKKWDLESSPFSYGVFSALIVISNKELEDQEYEMLFTHEFSHIKNHDLFWHMLSLFAVALNWYNPFAYYMRRELLKCSELISDEAAVMNSDMDLRKYYGKMIIDFSETSADVLPKESVAFSGSRISLEYRIKKILDMKKYKKSERMLAFIVTFFILFINTLTVFAYKENTIMMNSPEILVEQSEEVPLAYQVENGNKDEIKTTSIQDVEEKSMKEGIKESTFYFSDEIQDSVAYEFDHSEENYVEFGGMKQQAQFTDLNGNIFQIERVLDESPNQDSSLIQGFLKLYSEDQDYDIITTYNAIYDETDKAVYIVTLYSEAQKTK